MQQQSSPGAMFLPCLPEAQHAGLMPGQLIASFWREMMKSLQDDGT